MEDPLGIGGDDRKSKPHTTDFDDSDDDESDSAAAILSPRKAKRMAARKLKGALDPTDEKFDAVMYLVKVHQNTVIQDLQRGKTNVEVKVTSRQKQLEFLVKDNFARFMICKDAVDNIYVTISGQKMNNSAKVVDIATGEFKDLFNRSRAVFVPLLDRQVEIDRIKSVLGILKRSQFIFNLPRRMRDNIARGEYSKVVLNYKKVRSLVATASHASIKNVVGEVDAIVRELHSTLFEDLDQPNATLRQQEDSIKLLVDLGSPVDPAWYTMDLRHSRMKTMLIERASKANAVPESPHFSLGFSTQQARNSVSIITTVSAILQEHMPQFLQLANNFFSRTYHKSLSEKKKNALASKHSLPDFLVKLHELIALYSDIVIKSFYGSSARTMEEAAKLETRFDANPQLMPHAAESPASGPTLIVTGKKKKSQARTNNHRPSVSMDATAIPLSRQFAHAQSDAGILQTTTSNSSNSSSSSAGSTGLSQSSNALEGKTSTLTSQSAAQLGPKTATGTIVSSTTVPTPNLPGPPAATIMGIDEPLYDKEKVLAILKLYQQLTAISPPEWLEPLAELLDLVTRTFVKEVFADVLMEAKTWYAQEDWLVLDQQRMITSLPFTFESALTSTLDRLDGLVSAGDPLLVFLKKRFIQCIECYADNVHHLAFSSADSVYVAPGARTTVNKSHHVDHDDSDHEHDDFNSGRYETPSLTDDARLLMLLNNSIYTKKHILPALIDKFQRQYEIPLYDMRAREGKELLERLEDMIIRKYVSRKTKILNEVIRSGIIFSGLDWATVQAPPNGVRDYVMTTLLELVFIHDELHRVSRTLVRPVLTTVLENIYQGFIDCLNYIDTISNHGVLQIGMELEFLSSVMRKYKSPIANGLTSELEYVLQYNAIMDPKSDEVLAKDKKIVKGIVSSKIQEASLLIECFTGRDANDVGM